MALLYRKSSSLAALAALWAMHVCLFAGCSLEPPAKREIRAHNSLKHGVAHAEPSLNAERYCQQCHGVNLAGGSDGPPSCYQCHGKNWNTLDPATSLAPADHTVVQAGFRHHPDLNTSSGTCQSCHGLDLQGAGGANGFPSCYLCHDQRWP